MCSTSEDALVRRQMLELECQPVSCKLDIIVFERTVVTHGSDQVITSRSRTKVALGDRGCLVPGHCCEDEALIALYLWSLPNSQLHSDPCPILQQRPDDSIRRLHSLRAECVSHAWRPTAQQCRGRAGGSPAPHLVTSLPTPMERLERCLTPTLRRRIVNYRRDNTTTTTPQIRTTDGRPRWTPKHLTRAKSVTPAACACACACSVFCTGRTQYVCTCKNPGRDDFGREAGQRNAPQTGPPDRLTDCPSPPSLFLSLPLAFLSALRRRCPLRPPPSPPGQSRPCDPAADQVAGSFPFPTRITLSERVSYPSRAPGSFLDRRRTPRT